MDDIFWGIVCLAALLLMAGMVIGGIVIGVALHSWPVLAVAIAAGAAWTAIFTLGRDREPRERREVQKGARWP